MKERAFESRFADADNDKLLNYASYWAKELGIGPDYTDILGAAVLLERFGSWDRLLFKIGWKLTPYNERKDVPGLFVREVAAQERIYKRILAAMRQNELEFAENHAGDSDEELFAYVRSWAKRLRHTPNPEEVLGGGYIRKRFKNDWQRVLYLAGLPHHSNFPPRHCCRLIYLDEAKKQLAIYIEESMQEIEKIMQGKRVIYVAPAENAV